VRTKTAISRVACGQCEDDNGNFNAETRRRGVSYPGGIRDGTR
jgi:hypothetical protein